MLDREEQWSRALARNNVRVILRWLRSLLAEIGDAEVDERLATFSRWVQRTAEFTKKELLTLCLSRCQGLWMFLEQSSFTRVHLLVQRLRNLLILAQWGRRQLSLAHLWHGLGVPCETCVGARGSSAVGRGCWERERRALKQHIWLGRLVQWWGITGLLPKCPDAQELKRISQMWREMDHSHRRASLHTADWEEGARERWSSLIEGTVAQVNKQRGPVWMLEDFTDQVYPPPSLQALLKLTLVPHVDNMSVQTIIMYFILDMANFLQCKDNLLQSFCHAFTIPPQVSQQIRGFWLLDHGHVSAAMELLLSPRSACPRQPWQHRCILRSLLRRKQPRLALKYLLWTGPTMDGPDDLKLCLEVLLQNGRVTDAWALIRQGHTGSDDIVGYFLQACERLGLCAEASSCKGAVAYKSDDHDDDDEGDGVEESSLRPQRAMWTHLAVKESGLPLRPFSAVLYQSQKTSAVSSQDVLRLLREAVRQLRPPRIRASEVVWTCEAQETGHSGLDVSSQALQPLLPGPSLLPGPPLLAGASPVDSPDQGEDQPLVTAEYSPCGKDKPQSPGRLSSPSVSTESSVSVFSFPSASSSPPCPNRARPYEYESTVTLQRISALLERHGRREECVATSADTLPGCTDLVLTLEGATAPDSFNNLSKEHEEELVFSTERGGEEILTCSSPLLGETAGRSAVQDLPLDRPRSKLNLPPQFYSNEDNQSVPSVSHNFLTSDYNKLDYCKSVSEEITPWAPNVTSVFTVTPSTDQSERVLPQSSIDIEPVKSRSFLELEPLQRASEPAQLDEALVCFRRDSHYAMDQPEILTSCALTEPTQLDLLLTRPQRRLSRSEITFGSALEGGSDTRGPEGGRHGRRFSLQDSSLLTSGRRTLRAETAGGGGVPGVGEASPGEETAGIRSSSCRQGPCRLDSGWEQAPETQRAPSDLLPPIQQLAATPGEKTSPVPGRPCSSSPTVLDPSAKQKEDKWEVKQEEEEEEPADRGASGTASQQRAEQEQGAPRQRGAWPRRVKRVKKA